MINEKQIHNLNLALTYVPEWGIWEAIRELYSNALDQGNPKMLLNHANQLVISSDGILKIDHLVMGVSQKDKAGAIGQHGEGMKLALLVLLRSGYDVKIYSGPYIYIPIKQMFGDTETVAIEVTYEPTGWIEGTDVFIYDWHEETTFSDRFITENDNRIAYKVPNGSAILRQVEPDIFVKGVWVSKAKGTWRPYGFGYNLLKQNMNRDRSVMEAWKMNSEIGEIWSQVDDPDMWELFFRAVENNQGEMHIHLNNYDAQIRSKEAVSTGFRRVHGPNAILGIGDGGERWICEDNGKKLVSVGQSMVDFMKEVGIQTDVDLAEDYMDKMITAIKKNELSKESNANLNHMRKLVRRYVEAFNPRMNIKIEPFAYPNEDIRAEAVYETLTIRVNVKALDSKQECIRIVIEELAHLVHETTDNTRQHQNAILDIAGKLFIIG